MKILDFDLEGSHFIIEADISLRQKADDNMESHWPRYFFENTQVYKETDGVISPFPITAVTWYGCPITANHAHGNNMPVMFRTDDGTLISNNEFADIGLFDSKQRVQEGTEYILPFTEYESDMVSAWNLEKKAYQDSLLDAFEYEDGFHAHEDLEDELPF